MAVKKAKIKKNSTAQKAKKKDVKAVKPKALLKHKGKNSVKVKASAKASAKEIIRKPVKTYLTDKELEYFKKLIIEEKNEILENARRLRESLVDQNTGDYVGDN